MTPPTKMPAKKVSTPSANPQSSRSPRRGGSGSSRDSRRKPAAPLEDDLTGEEGHDRELVHDRQAQLLGLGDRVGADREDVLGGDLQLGRDGGIALEHRLGVRLQRLDGLRPLESARVDDADGDEN